MNGAERCLVCYEPIAAATGEYHPRCARRLFGSTVAPTLELDTEGVETLALQVVNQRLALTGVQRKLSLSLVGSRSEGGRLTVVGALGGAFILKPPTPDHPHLPEVEDATMGLAELAGIAVAAHGLVRMRDGPLAYVTRRFDRKDGRKVAVEDLCQLSEKPTEAKYRSSYERAGKVLRAVSSNPGDDALRFFELVLFSFLIGNADMHLKNFSLLTRSDGLRGLSPAYDLLSTRLLLDERLDPEELALSVSGRKRKLERKDFVALAGSLAIPPVVVERTFTRLGRQSKAWATHIDRSFLPAVMRSDLKALVQERSRRLDLRPA